MCKFEQAVGVILLLSTIILIEGSEITREHSENAALRRELDAFREYEKTRARPALLPLSEIVPIPSSSAKAQRLLEPGR